jgi:hypothetical protein
MADPLSAQKRKEIKEKAISVQSHTKVFAKVAVAIVQQNAGFAQFLGNDALDEYPMIGPQKDIPVFDHRLLPRPQRKELRHELIRGRIYHNYLNPYPLFDGKEFQTAFRISRSRFQMIMEDFAATGDPFYLSRIDAFGRVGASFEAKLLLPLKCMAYGVPPHCFLDYFEMSKTLARECCYHFDRKMKEVYIKEYLRCPDAIDLKRINKLHKVVHGVEGMFGSLDCMHTYWKNCPVAWQGSFEGKEKTPSIVLEAISDHHMWFWHAAYGYAGCMNDISIFSVSPFLSKLLSGEFAELEKDIAPFVVGDSQLNQMYMLVDGIYPPYSRFVRANPVPVSEVEKMFTKWQESARKDIERAFGVLKGKWQCLDRPQYFIHLEHIGLRVCSCLILHNMCVSDRVMDGDVRARYNPYNSVETGSTRVRYPPDLRKKQGKTRADEVSNVGIKNLGGDAASLVTRKSRFDFLKDPQQTRKVHKAFTAHFAQRLKK